MSVERIGTTSNIVALAETQRAMKQQKRPEQDMTQGVTVSIGEGKAQSPVQVKYPPLLPIGHTQGIYELDE